MIDPKYIYTCKGVAFKLETYHEDFGPVLWWRFPIEEAPWVGTPLDGDWIDDYYTHWTPLVIPIKREEDC